MSNGLYLRDAIIISVFFIVSLILILIYGKKLPKAKMNFCFSLVITFLYIFFLIAVYKHWNDGGRDSWIFENALPTANVSPLMFFLVSISWVLPKKFKNWLYIMISILCLGFAVAGGLLIFVYASNLWEIPYLYFNSLDILNHFVFSLFGIYLIKSNQIDLNFKKFLICISFLIGYILLLVLINVIFGTTFFGLCFTSEFNIYRMKIVSNAYLSALLYFFGLAVVLLSGYFFQKLIKKKNKSPV